MTFKSVLLAALLGFLAIESAVAVYYPPPGSATVGEGGTYATLGEALDDQHTNEFFIYGGTYVGQTVIRRSNIKIHGQTMSDIDYQYNTVTLKDGKKAADTGNNDSAATVSVQGTNVTFYNMNVVNTYGNPSKHSQAPALSVQAGLFGCYGCKITGYQVTLLANQGYQFYSNCFIEGAVNFIEGRRASVWITSSIIHTIGDGWITASGREYEDPFYFVINKSEVSGVGKQYLGRPWSEFARVIVQNSYLHSQIQRAGWSIWNKGDERLGHVLLGEYNNKGDGSKGPRASFSTKLSEPISIETVLGPIYTFWVDDRYPL